VDLLTYPQGEDLGLPGVRHRRSLSLPVGRVRAGPSLKKIVLDVPFMVEAFWRMLRGSYDVVHATEEAAHLAAPLARLLHLPLVMDMDSAIPDQLLYSGFATRGPLLWASRVLEGHALRHAVAVVTVCRSLTESVRASAPGAIVFQVEDPPLLDRTQAPDANAIAELRQTLGLGRLPVVLYAGNFEKYQGVELLIEAAHHLPEAQFLFVGGEVDEVETLKAKAPKPRCVFAGKRETSELPLFLGLADVLASPRIRGANTPFKVYTYLASGKPVVATRIASHTELLDDTNAYLVEPTPLGLASGIRRALQSPAEAEARAKSGQDLLEREYSSERHAAKVKNAYSRIAALIRR